MREPRTPMLSWWCWELGIGSRKGRYNSRWRPRLGCFRLPAVRSERRPSSTFTYDLTFTLGITGMMSLCAGLQNNAAATAYRCILEPGTGLCTGAPLFSTRGHRLKRTQNRSSTNQSALTSPIRCWRPCDLSPVSLAWARRRLAPEAAPRIALAPTTAIVHSDSR